MQQSVDWSHSYYLTKIQKVAMLTIWISLHKNVLISISRFSIHQGSTLKDSRQFKGNPQYENSVWTCFRFHVQRRPSAKFKKNTKLATSLFPKLEIDRYEQRHSRFRDSIPCYDEKSSEKRFMGISLSYRYFAI